MENSNVQNNIIDLSGQIISDFVYSHQVYGEAFYTFQLKSKRLSDTYDILPVTVSERLLIDIDANKGAFVSLKGQLRSYNSYSEGKTHLILTVFAKSIETAEESLNDVNNIVLNGYICKTPVYRTTPFNREISDILLAVNRAYKKSDYIPIICWGRNAKFASNLQVGSNILVTGRMQSRNYQKKLSETEVAEKTAYEVSVSKIELISNDIDK
ncbi:MAG: single-stranded DNA-binding protein [Clostridia bacterium]|nr:single-stranded DNA-binding protein [Clostridia bacterium]